MFEFEYLPIVKKIMYDGIPVSIEFLVVCGRSCNGDVSIVVAAKGHTCAATSDSQRRSQGWVVVIETTRPSSRKILVSQQGRVYTAFLSLPAHRDKMQTCATDRALRRAPKGTVFCWQRDSLLLQQDETTLTRAGVAQATPLPQWDAYKRWNLVGLGISRDRKKRQENTSGTRRLGETRRATVSDRFEEQKICAIERCRDEPHSVLREGQEADRGALGERMSKCVREHA